MMFDNIINSFMVQNAINVNRLIHFFRTIPIIGKKIPVSLYKINELKILFVVVGVIWGLIETVFKKALYCILMFAVPLQVAVFTISDIMENSYQMDYVAGIVLLFLVFNVLSGSMLNDVITDYSESKFYMINLLRMEPKAYIFSRLVFLIVIDFTALLLPLSVILCIYNDSLTGILIALMLVVYKTCARILFEAINALMYDKYGYNEKRNNAISFWIIAVLLIALLVSLFAFNGCPMVFAIMRNPITIIIVCLCTMVALRYLLKFKHYNSMQREIVTYSHVMTGASGTNVSMSTNVKDTVKYNDEALEKMELNNDKHAKKSGYEYLNAIFFDRHSYTIRMGWLVKVGIATLAVLVAAGITIFMDISSDEINVAPYTGTILGIFLFVFYAFNSVENMTKIMFYHCDVSLLKYGYYKQPKALLKCYLIRLKKILIMDMTMALIIDFGVTGFILVNRYGTFMDVLPITIGLLLEMAFIDMFRLMMYYVFQPYTEQGEVKGFMYKLCSVILYMFCWTGTQMNENTMIYAYLVYGASLLFIPVSQILVYKLAPKGFKIR